MQVEIVKNLLLFSETTTIFFIQIRLYFSFALHLKVIFYFRFYKYIVWLEISTRKYASRYEKLKKRRKEEKLIESQKGSMDKFVISNKQNITQNLDENITNE